MTTAPSDLDYRTRHRLQELGVPDRYLYDSKKALYLDAIAQDANATVEAAAAAAGVSSAAVRKWRERDPSFRDVEQRARLIGDRPEREPDDEPTLALGEIAEHRARYDRSMKVTSSIGPGPWKCTKAQREKNEGAYRHNREAALEAIAALRRLGVDASLPEPPAAEPLPPRQASAPRQLLGTAVTDKETAMTDWTQYPDAEIDEHYNLATGLVEDDPDAWSGFRDEIEQEKQRRREEQRKLEERAEQAAAQARAEAYAKTPKGKIAALRKLLAAAEKELAKHQDVTSGLPAKVHPDVVQDQRSNPAHAAKIEAGMRAAALREQIETAEARLPYIGMDDDAITDTVAELEQRSANLMSTVATADKEARETGIRDPRKQATVEKARRELKEIEASWSPSATRPNTARSIVSIASVPSSWRSRSPSA